VGGSIVLTLFYAPGACSMASHILLEEIGEPYEIKPVALAKGEQRTEAYLKINPRGRVPALRLDSGEVLSENVAILPYIAKSHPKAKLLPTDPLGEARCVSLMGFFSSSVHVAFAHIGRPERYAADEAAFPTVKEAGRKAFFNYLKDIDGMLAGKEWFFDHFTACDPYGLVFYWWGKRIELPVQELANYTAHKDRMLKRPAVKRVLEQEQIPLT
jgi:glutathione S-transferase